MKWILRFEDIDRPRVQEGALQFQLEDMRQLGLISSEKYKLQSESHHRHWNLFLRAQAEKLIYPCFCSRKEILERLASAPHGHEAVYGGHCRNLKEADTRTAKESVAWRFRNTESSGAEDFIVARTRALAPIEKDFVPSYQWACAIDDYDGNHQLLVRAWDLKQSTHQQRAIFRVLCEWEGSRVLPAVFHTSLITQNDGHRLEKRSRGVTLPELIDRGFSTKKILEIFRSSFQIKVEDFHVSKIFGESRETISLGDLSL